MNSQIMEWSSKNLYKGKLLAASSVEQRSLTDLYTDLESDYSSKPLCFIDTAGTQMYEAIDEQSFTESKQNIGEADLVC